MDVIQIRSDGDAVQTFHFTAEQAALQTCMDGHDSRIPVVHFLVYRHTGIPQLRLMTVLPARIGSLLLVGSAQELYAVTETVAQLLLLGFDGAADAEGSGRLAL